jgi:hypothetical protein
MLVSASGLVLLKSASDWETTLEAKKADVFRPLVHQY